MVLRWAKESILLAGYDQPAMEAHLGVSTDRPEVLAALSRCKPRRPQDVDDARFTDTFRRPSVCLDQIRASCGRSALHKSSPEIDDALHAMARESLSTLRARVPDLGRIASLVWRLHRKEEPTPPAQDPGGKARKKPRTGGR